MTSSVPKRQSGQNIDVKEGNQMDEFNHLEEATSETDDRREIIKQKLRQYYDGRIVRKDLTKSIRERKSLCV